MHHLDPWARSWAADGMLSAEPGLGAADGHYEVSLRIEQAITAAWQFGGGCTDLAQCFDRIMRELVVPLALFAGMPIDILVTYIRFLEGLRIYNAYATGLGTPRQRAICIPQGCPFSMRILAIITRPWIMLVRQSGVIPRIIADDLTILATKHDAVWKAAEALLDSYNFIIAFGGKVRVTKTWAFASDKAGRKVLKILAFPEQETEHI